jgi:anti-sigma factor ChrR (cupin superfamily)
MDHDEAALLLGAYAVHALEEDEELQVGAHLDDCARCRAEVSRYERVLTFLGHSKPHDAS